MRHVLSAVAAAVLASGSPVSAWAATQARTTQVPASAACQLSMPTVDTAVRAKATGFRNEGKTSSYAICGMQDPVAGAVSDAGIAFYSLDGKSHTFDCTAVNGWPDSGSYAYSTKSVTVISPTFRSSLHFAPADFGGTTYMPNEGYVSVTCLLPPQVSVGYMTLSYDEDVGS
jgi:hypothetical protein